MRETKLTAHDPLLFRNLEQSLEASSRFRLVYAVTMMVLICILLVVVVLRMRIVVFGMFRLCRRRRRTTLRARRTTLCARRVVSVVVTVSFPLLVAAVSFFRV